MYSSNNFDTSHRAFGCPPLQFSKVSNSCMLSHAKTKWSQAEQGTEQQIAKRASQDKDKPGIIQTTNMSVHVCHMSFPGT